jgi:Arc/MetJ-type ribon-helix-helix transcriptional regulator
MDTNLQISLSPPLKEWLDQRAATKGYQSSSELVEEMIRREQQLEFRSAIDEKLKNALASGESTPVNAEEWQRLRKLGQERAARRSAE